MKKFDLEEAMKNGIYSYVFGSKMLLKLVKVKKMLFDLIAEVVLKKRVPSIAM